MMTHSYEYDDDTRPGLERFSDRLPIMDSDAEEVFEIPICYVRVTQALYDSVGYTDDDDVEIGDECLMFGPPYEETKVARSLIEEVQVDILDTFYDDHEDDVNWELDEGDYKLVATVKCWFRRGTDESSRPWRLNSYMFKNVGDEEYITVGDEETDD